MCRSMRSAHDRQSLVEHLYETRPSAADWFAFGFVGSCGTDREPSASRVTEFNSKSSSRAERDSHKCASRMRVRLVRLYLNLSSEL